MFLIYHKEKNILENNLKLETYEIMKYNMSI